MNNDRRIRCQNIKNRQKSNLCIKISIRNKIMKGDFVIMKKKFHVMFELSCFVIIKMDFMKSFDITFKWNKDGSSNVILIQNQHEMKIIAEKNKFVKIKQIFSISLATIFFFIKVKISRALTRHQINVYVFETCILENEYEKNISTKHKFLAKGTYFFESIRQRNEALGIFVVGFNCLTKDEVNSISMTNMSQIQAKIRENQLIERLKHLKISNLSVATINFDYADVFMEKYEESKKFDNLFIIDFDQDKSENENSNINDH